MEAITLTSSHWVFLFWVIVIIILMGLRQDPLVPCILGTLSVAWVYKGSLIEGIIAIFNSLIVAGNEFWGIIVIISIIVALSKLLTETGADYILMSPLVKMMKKPSISFWVLGISMMIISWFFWPSPAVALIGAVMFPVAVRAGLPALSAAAAINLFGHGIALSTDYVIQGAPGITGRAAGFKGPTEVMMASIPLIIVMASVTTIAAFIIAKRDMKKNPGQILIDQKAVGVGAEPKLDRVSRIIAIMTPVAFLIDVIIMVRFELRGGDATALLGGTALLLLACGSLLKFKAEGFEKITDYTKAGFMFGIKIFAPVIIIGGFFFLGKGELAKLILNSDTATGYLEDFGLALAQSVPLNKAIAAVATLLSGIIVGLDGSGFSPLPLVGSIANTFSQAVSLDKATLAALGQIAGVWTGGGTIIPWGVIPVAAVCGVNPIDLARKNLVPVLLGFAATTLAAILFFL